MRRLHYVVMLLCFAVINAHAAPKIETWVAPSGAKVFFVENHDLPILDVQVDLSAGTAYEKASQAGVASLTHALLDMGVKGLDETAIANRLADLGAVMSGSVDMDRASVTLRTLANKDQREVALDLFQAILSVPEFPEEVFEREKSRTTAALKEALTRPDTIAGQVFWAALYPSHVYGYYATPETLEALRRDDLVSFYQKYYGARNAVVTVVGDVSRAEAEKLAETLTANLPLGEGSVVVEKPEKPKLLEKRIAHPASQAHVLIGTTAVKRGDADFFALVVGNYTLGGGGFVSRLMNEVREKRGYAYSVYSTFIPLSQAGPFQIGLQTKKPQVNEALQLTRDVLAEFLLKGPSEEELAAAKKNLIGSFPLRLDSNRKILANVATIGFYDLPLDYLESYAKNIEKVSAADVRAAFARHINPENMVTVIVAGE